MSAKHTPGPWSLPDSSSQNIFGGEISVDVLDVDGFPIADVQFEPILHNWTERFPRMKHWADGAESGKTVKTRDPEEAIANARLIAAAPELLDALKLLDEAFCAYDYGTREGRDKGRAALVAARAAIAKAEGTKP